MYTTKIVAPRMEPKGTPASTVCSARIFHPKPTEHVYY